MDLDKSCLRCNVRYPGHTAFSSHGTDLLLPVCPLCHAEKLAARNRISVRDVVTRVLAPGQESEYFQALRSSAGRWRPQTTSSEDWESFRREVSP